MALARAWGTPGALAESPELWIKYQTMLKSKQSGTAKWRVDWDFPLYKPGDVRDGVCVESASVCFRHKQCGGEYTTSNPSQTALKHKCDKVNMCYLAIFS